MYKDGNNGFLTGDASENNDSEQQFYSRDKGESPPQLVLTFGPEDRTPPQTTVDSGPDATTTSTSAQLRFSADEEGSTFECSRDGAPFTACTSPVNYTGLALGDHELRVRATDPAGNVDPTPASFAWRVIADTVAPETTLGSPPGGAPPATTTEKNATFTFTADDPGASFECSLDGGTFNACSSPKQYTNLSTEAHSFRVRAKDAAGNTGPAASYFWTIEAPPTPTCTASTVTAAANADAWVLQSSASSNYGTDSVLKVDSKSGANARASVRLALPQVPAGCQVTGATLRLHSASYKEGRTLQALRLGGSWTEGGVKWSGQPATTGSAATAPAALGQRRVRRVERALPRPVHVLRQQQRLLDPRRRRERRRVRPGLQGADNPPQLVISFG
jgi:large repetitive protein